MNRFFKLLNMELNRFSKILFGMVVGVFIIQTAGLMIEGKAYMDRVNNLIMSGVTKEAIIEDYGIYGMGDYVKSLWFNAPIALCAGAIFLYIFLIWYRDWTGKNTFIYRLLMLPTSRMNIYFSKLTAVMLLVFFLVSVQLLFLPIESEILEWFISPDYLLDTTIIGLIQVSYLKYIIPPTFTQFILYYGAGFIALTVLFLAVLFERSFKWKGILLAIVYCISSVIVFVSPIIIIDWLEVSSYFYSSEVVIIVCIAGIMIGIASILLSRFLLNKKVTV